VTLLLPTLRLEREANMARLIDVIRPPLRSVGLNPEWVRPARGPDGKTVVTIRAYRDPDLATPVEQEQPEAMIVQPAPDLAQFREFEKIPGIGPVTADKLRGAGVRSLGHFYKANATAVAGLREIVGSRAVALIDEYIDAHFGDVTS
jgi:hypothetical protein